MASARPAVVGGFVLGGLALAVLVILLFGGSRLFETTTRAIVYFADSVAGLSVGAPVTFRGVPVGSVQDMSLRLSPNGQARIAVTLELLPDRITIDEKSSQEHQASLEALIAAGLRAQLEVQSFITGQLRVNLDFRPDTPAERFAAATSRLPEIPALPSDMERLRATVAELPLKELTENAGRVLVAIERLADRLDTELGPLMESTRTSMASANRTLDTSQQAIAHLDAELTRTLQDFDRLAVDARQQLKGRSGDLAKLLASADRATRRADSLLGSLDALAGPRSPARGDLEAAIRDLAASAASMRGFSQAIERDPSTLLRGRGGQ
jgi:paraquat-inducible protein B